MFVCFKIHLKVKIFQDYKKNNNFVFHFLITVNFVPTYTDTTVLHGTNKIFQTRDLIMQIKFASFLPCYEATFNK